MRDLGGLRTHDGRTTSRGAIVRADDLDRLTDALLVDARVARRADDRRPPKRRGTWTLARAVATVHVPLDDTADKKFWRACWADELDGTHIY